MLMQQLAAADAQFQLGNCYREGIGAAANSEQALFWFERAADQGEPEAMNAIGRNRSS
jgi:TPR repeat protein